MKQLLKLLAVLTIATPTSLSLVACGGDKSSTPTPDPNDEPTDTSSLLKQVEYKITDLFSNLISESKNLLKPGNFEQKDDGTLLTTVDAATNDQEIKDISITNLFFELIQKNMEDFGSQLASDKDINKLFYGINTNDILTFNINKSTITKNTFDEWTQDNAFGIAGYSKTKYHVTSWNFLSSALNLTLKYKDDDGQVIEHELKPNYDFYLANQDAQLEEIIKAVSDNVTKSLKDYVAQVTGPTQYDISTYVNKFKPLETAAETIILKLINNNNVKINNCFFKNTNSMISNWLDNIYKSTIKTHWKIDVIKQLHRMEERFLPKLNNWEGKNLIKSDKLNNVSLFSDLKLTDWKYENLTLLPFDVKTALIEDKTRTEKIEMLATKTSEIAAYDGLIADKIKTGNDFYKQTISLTMNASDFDKYITDQNTFGDTAQYIENKLKPLALSKSILDSDDFLNVYFTHESDDSFKTPIKNNLKDNKSIWKRNNTKMLSPNLTINVSGLEINFGYLTEYTVIKGADNSIWSKL